MQMMFLSQEFTFRLLFHGSSQQIMFFLQKMSCFRCATVDRSGVRNLFSTLYRALEVIIHGENNGGPVGP